jgi:outer membrane receptor protein involved in Fe transport
MSSAASAAEVVRKLFDLPSDLAEKSLRRFSAQSGVQVLFPTAVVAGVRTQPVHGTFTSREALEHMLEKTPLRIVQNEKTGSLTVTRIAPTEDAPPPPPGNDFPPTPKTKNSTPTMNRRNPGLITGLIALAATAGQAADTGQNSPKPEETVQLSAFEVVGDSDISYGALNSNSITRFNTELKSLPASADILTETFMRDVAATSVEDMILNYNAGSGMTYSDPGSATTQPGDRNAESAVQIRGLYTPTMQRDGFLPLWTYSTSSTTGTGFTSNFDIERVEIIKGPQSLLYGSGGGGGVINTVSKQARLGKHPAGSLSYKVDQYGTKSAQFDYGLGTDRLALRVAAVHESTRSRRVNIGGELEGYYAQIAYRPFNNTVIRLLGEKTLYDSIRSSNLTLNTQNATFDRRHGQYLHYLLATDQLTASASGPGGAGAIDNGRLNWDNVDSYAGWMAAENTRDSFAILTAETKWNSWLSTQVAAGYKDFIAENYTGSASLMAPNVTANPLKVWTIASSSAGGDERATVTKAVRASVLAEHKLFRGRVHSQTILGVDYSRTDPSYISFNYYLADANGNVIRNATGRPTTAAPARYWSVADGIVREPLPKPGAARITVNGNTYVRTVANPPNPANVTSDNPLGVQLGGTNFYILKLLNRGYYGANYATWFDGKMTTLFGFRLASLVQETLFPGRAPTANDPNTYATKLVEVKNKLSYQAGVSYALNSWLQPYVSFSSSFNPAVAQRNDPYGDIPDSSEATGQEAGIKFNVLGDRLSGSFAYFRVSSDKEQIRTEAQIQDYVNPEGLNGTYKSPSIWLNVDREVQGLELMLTASPIKNWRMRVSAALTDGELGSTRTYAQLYNDQFHQNSQGQVTYADGTVVYVPPTYSASQRAVTASTPGAIPLTIAMMSAPGNSYYANPTPVTGQINGSSNAAQVLRVVDPVHGAILTGVTGLPITQLQINPGFKPPGVIPAAVAGDVTTGYAKYGFNYTNLYTVTEGWAKGVRLGGTVALAWQNRSHYYYPGGVGVDSNRTLFLRPDRRRVDFILGYERRLGRITWSTQLNVSNAFNHYSVTILPSSVTGYSGVLNAVYSDQPRAYVWTNTIKF